MYKININDVPERGIRRSYKKGVAIRYLLVEEFGTPHFEMRYFELEKGASSSEDLHDYEHEVFIVRGEGTLLLNDREYTLTPGDAIFIAANEKHQLLQKGSEALGFICVVPNGVSRGKNEIDLSYPHES
jgi:quercetin dioxygenase-like cupin family protein